MLYDDDDDDDECYATKSIRLGQWALNPPQIGQI